MSSPSPLEEIFFAALEKGSTVERTAYLDEACSGDDKLRDRVERMLAARPKAESFLEVPAQEIDQTIDQSMCEKAGTQVGRYKLLEKIGEGGMGVVYMAEQREPVKRRVALKIIKPGMDTSQVIARFEAERQALALMDHPNIAKVFDAGATESGRPYFVMELVNGLPLTEYCDEQHFTLRERLALFVPICQAVQHAHQKGVIHRDLKPSNILVAEYDHEAVPKIIDFGVAKATSQQLTDKTLFTQFGQIIGTLEYAAPEQAKRNQLDIDTRSDIYSLGVVLYELLTGDTPFGRERLRSAALDEMLQMLREEDPPPPSTRLSTSATLPIIAANRRIEPAKISSAVRREPDWIVMKSLDKDRDRRYVTASALAEDIQRYLAGEPVEAGPPSITYQLRKSFSRHRTAWVTTAAVFVALVSGLAAALLSMHKAHVAQEETAKALSIADEERIKANLARSEAEQQRQRAENSAESERMERERAERTTGLLLDILSRASRNSKTGKDYTIAEALLELGDVLLSELKSIEGKRQGRSRAVAAKVHLAIGCSYFRSREFDLAIEHLEKAHSFSNQTRTEEGQLPAKERTKLLSTLGTSCVYQGDLEKAEGYLARARVLFDETNAAGSIEEIPYLALSWLSSAKGDLAGAEGNREKAMKAAMRLPPGTGWARLLDQLVQEERLQLAELPFLVITKWLPLKHDIKYYVSNSIIFEYRWCGEQSRAAQLAQQKFELSVDRKDQPNVAWNLTRICRAYCDVQDFARAEKMLRPWVDDEEFMKELRRKSVTAYFGFRSEMAYFLERLGRDDEASAFRKEVATNLAKSIAEGRRSFGDFDNVLQLECELRTNEGVDLTEFLPRTDDLYERASNQSNEEWIPWLQSLVARIRGLAYQRAGRLEEAIGPYEEAATKREFYNEMCHLDDVEYALVDFYTRTHQLSRGEEFFDGLLTARQESLHQNHPGLAFTKILLAQIVILQDTNLGRAKSLLQDAQTLLKDNELTPDHVLNNIDDLLAQVQEKLTS